MVYRYQYKKGIKFKITRNRLLLLAIIVLSVFTFYFYFTFLPKPVYEAYFDNIKLAFRANLREAEKIKVYPHESSVYSLIWNPEVKNITIAFVNSSDNSYVAVEAFEIAFKLKVAINKFNLPIQINSKEISSFKIKTTKENPYIILVPPALSKETLVKAEENLIFIKAKDYKEFDLATIKFLMVALNIRM